MKHTGFIFNSLPNENSNKIPEKIEKKNFLFQLQCFGVLGT